MLSRLQSSILQRTSYQTLESSLYTACSLLQAAVSGVVDAPQQSRLFATGGRLPNPEKGSQSGGGTGNSNNRLQRRNWDRNDRSRPSGGGGDGNYARQRGGPRMAQGGQGRWQRQRDGRGGDIMDAVLGNARAPAAATAPGSLAQHIAPLTINTDFLPLADYIVRREDVQRYKDGRMGPEERKTLVNKLRNTMFNDPRKVARMVQTDIDLESDPNYRIEDALVFGGPAPAAAQAPEETLDQYKKQLCALLGVSEAEFDKYKAQAAKEFSDVAVPMISEQDPRQREQKLEQLLEEMPPAQENYESAVAKLRVLQNNPNWPHEKKIVFARRLLRRLA